MEVLGMEGLQDTILGPDIRWFLTAPRGAQTSITLVTWFSSMPPGFLKGIVLEAEDLERPIAEIEGRAFSQQIPHLFASAKGEQIASPTLTWRCTFGRSRSDVDRRRARRAVQILRSCR